MADPDFGEEVRIVEGAPPKSSVPGTGDWIVGLSTANRNLLVIEFQDGSSLEVPPEVVRSQT